MSFLRSGSVAQSDNTSAPVVEPLGCQPAPLVGATATTAPTTWNGVILRLVPDRRLEGAIERGRNMRAGPLPVLQAEAGSLPRTTALHHVPRLAEVRGGLCHRDFFQTIEDPSNAPAHVAFRHPALGSHLLDDVARGVGGRGGCHH